MPVSIRIVLDTRRLKQKTGKYPVKLLVVHNRQPQRCQTIFELTKEEFKILSAPRITLNLQKTRDGIREIKRKAEEVALDIVPFSFNEFEKEYIYDNPLFIQRLYIKRSTAAFIEHEPRHEAESRARDYWMLLYLCNGINLKDLALLKYKNVQDGYLHFERAKTINTGRSDPKTITVYITEEIQSIVDRLGNTDRSPENYMFPILQHGIDELREHELIKLFIAFVNNWIAEIAKALSLPCKPTTVISRHTFDNGVYSGGTGSPHQGDDRILFRQF